MNVAPLLAGAPRRQLCQTPEDQVAGFLRRYRGRISQHVLECGLREVLIHFARKAAAGRVVMLALPGETAPRARSEYELVTTLFAELPINGPQPQKGIR